MNKLLSIFFSIVFVSFSTINYTYAQAPAPEAQKSLYDRLGEVSAIAAVVNDFIERLRNDPVILANKIVAASLPDSKIPGLKFLLTEMVCEATGGPQSYTGRPMKESHQHLKITEAEWQAMVKDFLATLTKFKVPEKEQNELLAIVGSTKGDIVISEAVKKAPEASAPAPEAPAPEAPAPEAPALQAPAPEAPAHQVPPPDLPALETLPAPVEAPPPPPPLPPPPPAPVQQAPPPGSPE